jgi:hypothetical protein
MNTCASLGDPKNGGRLNMQRIYLETIGLPEKFDLGESDLSQSTSTLNELYNQVNALNTNFLNFLLSQIGLLSSPKKMQKWHEFKFSEFIIELNKGIKTANRTPLTKLEEMEWMEVFEAKKKNILELKAEIEKTEKVIDQLVYTLYGLTDEEIKIVEGA